MIIEKRKQPTKQVSQSGINIFQIVILVNALLGTDMRSKLADLLYSETRILPNRFTIALGNLIKDARIEAKLSQGDLAELAYFRQSSISKIEAGMRTIAVEDILYLSYALNKPIRYFFPKKFTDELDGEDVGILEEELLLQARRLSRDDLEKLVAQARALAEFRPNKTNAEASSNHQEEF